jgi:hypothetical protein
LSFLSERGHGQGVVDFIKRHWARMAEHGTTWENFAPRPADESFSHAWSAHPLFHLMQTLGGVRQAAPDWKSITYKPVFHGTRCDTVIPTPRGLIKSKWRKTGNKIQVELDLPPGMTARVLLFGGKSQTAKGKWRALLSADKK